MRFIGNKAAILPEIIDFMQEKGLLDNHPVLFDAFCGTGSVSDALKLSCNISINDTLKWAVIYSTGRICGASCRFDRLGFDPFEQLNDENASTKGFFYTNYSTAESDRMYFTPQNAARIDYMRIKIEQWRDGDLLTPYEYAYLLACLIEAVSLVSNTAGVYGAFLKEWDVRALKPIIITPLDCAEYNCDSFTAYNDRIENIIEDVDCDILYLDPPYTQNQYGTQYHLLETLVLYDNPTISKVTGSRPTAPYRSDWSREYKVNILLDKVLAKTKAKHVLLSYSNDGFMSREFIEASMKRYGIAETYECRKIPYKKYRNWKSQNENEHFEYLFYIEKKPAKEVFYESPLNYMGSKAKIIGDIEQYADSTKDCFMDIFGGGFNVGININTDKVVYNDINFYVKDLVESFKNYDTYEYLVYIKKTIKKFGLEKANEEAYKEARKYYNELPAEQKDPRLLFTIILYGYQQQIRFNSKHEFNNPVGVRWFNDKILEKVVSFSRRLKEGNFIFASHNYKELVEKADENSFVYMDPPYNLTTGSYNDGKRGFNGWSIEQEQEMFNLADDLTQKNVKFMLSYVLDHKGQHNENLERWVADNNYNLIPLKDVVGISGSRRKEVLVVNYDPA